MSDDLRTYLQNHLEGIRVTTMRDGEPSGLMPTDIGRIAGIMTDAVLDLAGQGELLKAIERMSR